MKIKVLSRNPDDYLRETKHDLFKVSRNYAPTSHPLQAVREYKRALNAAKLERVFAKPFVCSLDAHSDGVSKLAKCHTRLSVMLSGSYDGEICMWDLPQKSCLRRFAAHEGHVRGLSVDAVNGQVFTSVGDDMQIKMWPFNVDSCDDDPCSSSSSMGGHNGRKQRVDPKLVLSSASPLCDVSHSFGSDQFATCGDTVCLWSPCRSTPIRSVRWGGDTLTAVRFNPVPVPDPVKAFYMVWDCRPVETQLLAACGTDRSVTLYDCRGDAPLRRLTMQLRANAVAWNPMEAYVFTLASEDFNLYTFDARKLSSPVRVHEDFTGAVLDVDYSPTGTEFVAGGYDKTVRIFPVDQTRSREVYHTKRMHRVLSVLYTLDAKFVLSASDEMNIRMWKAAAAEKMGPLRPRERRALNYSQALRDKFSAHPQVRSITRHRQVPKHVHNAKMERHVIRLSHRRKEANRRRHGEGKDKGGERKKKVVRVE